MKTIDLNPDWQVESFDFHVGLTRKAYERGYQPGPEAMSTALPRTAQAVLVDHGRVPDPCTGGHREDLKWPEQKEWWYTRDFEPPELAAGQRVVLRIQGVTYRAEVWVNGHTVGHIEGMFREDHFDITGLLERDGRPNRLTLRTRTQEDAHLDDRGSPVRHHVRSQGVVAQAMSRWNWVPHLVAVGVWRPISLIVEDTVEVRHARFRTVRVDVSADEAAIPTVAPAELEATWAIENRSGETVERQLHAEIRSVDEPNADAAADATWSESLRVTLPPGVTTVTRRVDLPAARLWWSNGLGEAHLYRGRSRLTPPDGPADDLVPTSAHEVTFGVRQIEFVEGDDAEWVTQVSAHSARPWTMIQPLHPWVLKLNGRRVFLKGSNWVHADVLLRLEPQRYEKLLAPAKHGGLNFMRVWGGSLAETDDFYDTCDRLGLLCWQEFWLACANYPALDRDLLQRCAADTVRRLVNHPSLVFYSGGNEFEPDRIENKSAVDTLDRVVAEVDGHREFRRGSPYKGDKHGGLVPTPRAMRNKYLDILPGDARQVLFRSETAVGRSAPSFASLEKFVDAHWPLDESLWRHYFGVPSEFLGHAAEYAADDGYEPAVMANHLAHIRVLQVNLEYCRSQMFRCGGHLNWQYAVPWPCLHREIVDWWGVPKPAFHHYANACRDPALLVDLQRYLFDPGDTFDPVLYLVNDGLEQRDLDCSIHVLGVDGTSHLHHHWSATAATNCSMAQPAIDWTIPEALAEKSLLVFTRIERGGELLFQNAYWIAISNHVHDPDAKSLDGTWRRADGSELTLPGNDLTRGDDGFDSIVQKSLEKDFEHTAEDRDPDADERDAGWVSYRREFHLPKVLRGRPLEFFAAGIEAAVEVRINGVVVAAEGFRGSRLDLAAMAHVPAGTRDAQTRPDAATDYKFFSDPITMPRLRPLFADLPTQSETLRFGDAPEAANTIELRLKTDCQKTVTQSMCIRRRTDNREAVSRLLREGVLFGDLRKMPAADLQLESRDGRLELHNRGGVAAMLVLVDVVRDPDGAAEVVPLDDNALILMPGQRRRLMRLGGDPLPGGCKVIVRGWNVPRLELEA